MTDYDFEQFRGYAPPRDAAKEDKYDFSQFAGYNQPAPPLPTKSMWQRMIGPWEAGFRAASDSLSFGLANKLGDKLGMGSSEKTAKTREEHPYASLAGDVAGLAVPGMAAESAVTKAVPALAANTYLKNAARAAISGGALDAVDQGIRTGNYDFKRGALATGGAAALSPLLTFGARLFPQGRLRSAGTELSEADKATMVDRAQAAGGAGVPLNIPELAEAVAPGRAAGTTAYHKDLTSFPAGSVAAANWEAAREPLIEQAGRRVKGYLGRGIDPTDASRAAQDARIRAEDLVRNSAEPYYDAAMDVPFNGPVSRARSEATRNLSRNRVAMGEIADQQGTRSPNRQTIRFVDAVQKRMRGMAEGHFNAREPDPFTGSIYNRDRDLLVEAMDAAAPTYPVAREITEQGKRMTDRLSAGPLGTIERSPKVSTQSNSLFNATTDVERDLSVDAAKRMGDAARGIMANRADWATSKYPRDFGSKMLPTEQSEDVARIILGPDYEQIGPTLEAARSVSKDRPSPVYNADRGGPTSELWRSMRNLGTGRTVELLNDPGNIEKLGRTGPVNKATSAAFIAALIEALRQQQSAP